MSLDCSLEMPPELSVPLGIVTFMDSLFVDMVRDGPSGPYETRTGGIVGMGS